MKAKPSNKAKTKVKSCSALGDRPHRKGMGLVRAALGDNGRAFVRFQRLRRGIRRWNRLDRELQAYPVARKGDERYWHLISAFDGACGDMSDLALFDDAAQDVLFGDIGT